MNFGTTTGVIENNGEAVIVNGVINGDVNCNGDDISLNFVNGNVEGANFVYSTYSASNCDYVKYADDYAKGCGTVEHTLSAYGCGFVGSAYYHAAGCNVVEATTNAMDCGGIGFAENVYVSPNFSSAANRVSKMINNQGNLVVDTFGADGEGLYIKNSGELIINGDVNVELVDNIGTINFNGENILF